MSTKVLQELSTPLRYRKTKTFVVHRWLEDHYVKQGYILFRLLGSMLISCGFHKQSSINTEASNCKNCFLIAPEPEVPNQMLALPILRVCLVFPGLWMHHSNFCLCLYVAIFPL